MLRELKQSLTTDNSILKLTLIFNHLALIDIPWHLQEPDFFPKKKENRTLDNKDIFLLLVRDEWDNMLTLYSSNFSLVRFTLHGN